MRNSKRIRELMNALLEECDYNNGVTLTVRPEYLELTFHQVPTYEGGSEILRSLGIGKRSKSVRDGDTDSPWVSLQGEAERIEFKAFCQTLPPTCQIVTKTKRIPKQETVDTGDFIEVQQRRVVCGAA